jgi:curved DNA-binding protein CbpA
MKTLYDLLDARPDDDAERLKNAFRKAVKANHPDLHTDDPDAPLRLRQIVRANTILRDAQQRELYDRLLEFERQQFRSKPTRTYISAAMHNIVSDVIAIAVLAGALAGGYVLFAHLPNTSVAEVEVVEVTARGPTEIAALQPAARTDITGTVEPRGQLEDVAAPNEGIVPSTVAATADSGGAQAIADGGPAPDLPGNEAKFYRQRGTTSYRSGDLLQAIADFDRAIRLDPKFADAYVDRGIAWYRMSKFDRAFADVAQAVRIDNSHRTTTPPSKPRKASPSSEKN